MKSFELDFSGCVRSKTITGGLKEKALLSTKMERLCKKNIINKLNQSASFIDLSYQNKNSVDEIQLFGKKISRLYDHFVVVGSREFLSGTKAVLCLKKNQKKSKDCAESNVKVDVIFSGEFERMEEVLQSEDIAKTFFNFVIKDEFDVETLSMFSLAVAKLKEKLQEQFFVNITVTTEENNNLWNFCAQNHINTLALPKGVLDSFCTLSPVGLFAFSVAGINLENFLNGAKKMLENFKQTEAKNSVVFAFSNVIYNFFIFKKLNVKAVAIGELTESLASHFSQLLQFENCGTRGNLPVLFCIDKQNFNPKISQLKNENFDFSLPKNLQNLWSFSRSSFQSILAKKGEPSLVFDICDVSDESLGKTIFLCDIVGIVVHELLKISFSSKSKIFDIESLNLSKESCEKSKSKNKSNSAVETCKKSKEKKQKDSLKISF
jgi:hypothetical protein